MGQPVLPESVCNDDGENIVVVIDSFQKDAGQNSTELMKCDVEAENRHHAKLFHRSNIAIPLFYATLGFIYDFPSIAIRQYLREQLKQPPAIQSLVT